MAAENLIECLVCDFRTLHLRALHETCPICKWDDEGYIENISQPTHGPNGELSLKQAREKFESSHIHQPLNKYHCIADLNRSEAVNEFASLLKAYKNYAKKLDELDVMHKWTLQEYRGILEKLIKQSHGDIPDKQIKELLEVDIILKNKASEDEDFYYHKSKKLDEWWFRLQSR